MSRKRDKKKAKEALKALAAQAPHIVGLQHKPCGFFLKPTRTAEEFDERVKNHQAICPKMKRSRP